MKYRFPGSYAHRNFNREIVEREESEERRERGESEERRDRYERTSFMFFYNLSSYYTFTVEVKVDVICAISRYDKI